MRSSSLVGSVLLSLLLAVTACGRGKSESGSAGTSGGTRQDRAGTTGQSGMMGSGEMMGRGGMMGGATQDTAAAPKPAAVAASAPGCPDPTGPLVDEGRRIFASTGNCFSCHGSDARGTQVAPDLTDDTWLDVDGSYAAIDTLVNRGVAQPKLYPTPMPALGGARLDVRQACAVSAYVYSLSH